MAQARAAEQGMLVDPSTLSEAIASFVEWEAFTLWVRAVVAAEGGVPNIVAAALSARCSAFPRDTSSPERLWAELLDWIELNVFREATCQGWIDALTYHARRDTRSRTAWAHWEKVRDDWAASKPSRYPTVEEWLLSSGVS